LSPKSPVGYIDIRVFAHATEDTDKVLLSAHHTLPSELKEVVKFKETRLTGYYKNPIIIYQTRLTDKQTFIPILNYLSSNVTSLDKEDLTTNIKIHLDKGNLYLRFDKQAAYINTLKFSKKDPIHFKIHFKNKTSKEITDICEELGLLL